MRMSYRSMKEGSRRRSCEGLDSNSRTPLLESSSTIPPSSSSPDFKIDIPPTQEQELIFPDEPVKTVLSFLFLTFGFLVSSFSLALTHDRVPDYNPLPDIVLDNTTYHQWGLKVCEIIIIISILLAFLTVLLHTHRLIVIRRVFLILGLLYMYRGLTMFVTVLPIPDKNYKCAPQLKHTITFLELISRVVTILTEGGLSLTGNKFYCGDFIFSGHTMILMMTFFVVREYSPRTKKFLVLHLFSFLLSVTGVAMLLVSRGHYSIDCLVAYWVTSRVWWTYHTMANSNNLKMSGSHNHIGNIWWWYIFRYAEANVTGELPRRYSIPLPRGFNEAVRCIKEWCRWGGGGLHQRLEDTQE